MRPRLLALMCSRTKWADRPLDQDDQDHADWLAEVLRDGIPQKKEGEDS